MQFQINTKSPGTVVRALELESRNSIYWGGSGSQFHDVQHETTALAISKAFLFTLLHAVAYTENGNVPNEHLPGIKGDCYSRLGAGFNNLTLRVVGSVSQCTCSPSVAYHCVSAHSLGNCDLATLIVVYRLVILALLGAC